MSLPATCEPSVGKRHRSRAHAVSLLRTRRFFSAHTIIGFRAGGTKRNGKRQGEGLNKHTIEIVFTATKTFLVPITVRRPLFSFVVSFCLPGSDVCGWRGRLLFWKTRTTWQKRRRGQAAKTNYFISTIYVRNITTRVVGTAWFSRQLRNVDGWVIKNRYENYPKTLKVNFR